MKKLKSILNCNILYCILILFVFIYVSFYIFIYSKKSVYDVNDNSFECIIDNFYIDDVLLKIDLVCDEKLLGYYYFDDKDEKDLFLSNYKLGDMIKLYGTLEEFSDSNIPNLFNYKFYQYSNDVFYKVIIDEFYMIGYSKSFSYKIKNFIIDRISDLKSYSYLNAFILGDTNYIEKDVFSIYKNNNILHLFSISGMHISLLISMVGLFLKKDSIYKFVFISIIFFIFYFLIKSVSLLRSIVFYFINYFNKKFNLEISKIRILIVLIAVMLIVNPFYIYNIGFWYSFLISSFLFLYSDKIVNIKNYLLKLLIISIISFFVSFPITIFNSYEINLFSIFSNIIFVPLISFVIYPLCLIVLIFNFFDIFLYNLLLLFEYFSFFLDGFSINLIFMKPNLFIIVVYYFIIFLSIKNIKFIILLFFLIFCHYNFFIYYKFVSFIDVGQGDCILIHDGKYNILIDSGGFFSYDMVNDYSLANSQLIPYFKSIGIRKINALIISHGDYDHMGEAINLVNNFKVEKVMFNCGDFNDLEKELIKVLDNKKIPYYSCIKELNIDDNKLYFLNNKDYGNENDNSSVVYTKFNNYKFLFMGDAGVEVEGDLIEKYNLNNIDVLKVGHHGSKTSSSKEFINEINPKYSIISVGKNNRYGHPNKEVLINLDNSRVYRTDEYGSIIFKIKNYKLYIETCV